VPFYNLEFIVSPSTFEVGPDAKVELCKLGNNPWLEKEAFSGFDGDQRVKFSTYP
jgi:hypothetical protein